MSRQQNRGHPTTSLVGVAGASKNQVSSQSKPRSLAARRIARISSSEGAAPLSSSSHRETVAWVTPAKMANSACVDLKTFRRMWRMALIDADNMRKRIVCKPNFMRKRIFVYPRAMQASSA